MLLVQPLISYEFPAINSTMKAQFRTAIQDGKYAANMRQICGNYAATMRQLCGKYAANMRQICGKYAANMRTRKSISQSATGTTISYDVNWSLSISALSLNEFFESTLYWLYTVIITSFSMS